MEKIKILKNVFSIDNLKNAFLWCALIIIFALPFGLKQSIIIVLPLIVPVHLNHYFLDKYFKNEMYYRYALLTFFILTVFGIFAQFLGDISHGGNEIHYQEAVIIKNSFIDRVNAALNPTIAVTLTTLYRFFIEKKEHKILEAESIKVKAELNMLKHQVNPHFLFNTLNNLFSMSSSYGDEATANGIGHLSHLMRYMLYDTNSELVGLENEIDMLRNFIDLQKLRFESESVNNISLKVKGDYIDKKLPPMLLIPFLENAFKHSYSTNNEFFVRIELLVTDNTLNFYVENSINKVRKGNNLDASGIGLKNVSKRLDLLFKDEYLLKINSKENIYAVSLNLPLMS